MEGSKKAGAAVSMSKGLFKGEGISVLECVQAHKQKVDKGGKGRSEGEPGETQQWVVG